MNRREFLKGTLGGVFGALLTWAGVVRGEEPQPLTLTGEEKRQAVENHIIAEASNAFEELEQAQPVWNWPYEPYPVGERGPWDGTAWFWDPANGDDSNDGLSPETALQTHTAIGARISAASCPSGDTIFSMPGTESEPITSDQAFDATIASINKWNGRLSDNVSRDYTRSFQHRPDSDLGRVFSQNGQIDWPRTRAVLEEIGILPRDVDCNIYQEDCSGCPALSRCLAENTAVPVLGPAEMMGWDGVNDSIDVYSDNVSRDYTADTGGAYPWYEGLPDGPWEEDGGRVASGLSRWIYWDNDGSDEDGTGTYEDPVATEACAQSIADNPFRI